MTSISIKPESEQSIGELQDPMLFDLAAVYAQMQLDVFKVLHEGADAGKTPEEIMAEIDALLGPEPTGDSVVMKGARVEKGFNRIADSATDEISLKELELGVPSEMAEHGISLQEAVKVATDHLAEHPDYYTRLQAAGLL